MAATEDSDIPETGAVFTFGKSKFADNLPNKFWVKNDRVSQVACGDEHTALVVESGRVFMFGLNDWGQLGLGQDVKPGVNKPSCIKTLKHEKSKLVACGRSHTIISTEAGHIYSFGSNSEGQLGIADAPDQYTPRHVVSLEPANYKMISAGSDSSMALTENGKLFVWGGNEDGKLGLGEDIPNASVPEHLEFDHPVVCVACGYYHTAVVTDDGKLYTMGEADGGKLGLSEDVENTKVPNHVATIPDPVKWVACGSSHTIALTEFGEVYVFGEGENGQLGLGTELLSTPTPTHLQLPFKVAWVFCGQDFTALISERGQLYTCGDGRYGKLGHGSDQYSNLYKPSHCKRFSHFMVEKVACGGCHMIVTAKLKMPDGKFESDDEADEFKFLSDTLSKSEESPSLTRSLSARERRHKELKKSYSGLSQTLPALASFKGLSSLNATMPALKSSQPKINGHPLNKTVVPKLNNIPNGKASHINSSEESEDEEEEKSEDQKPTNKALPVASPRRKPPQLQEQGHVEDGSDGDDEDDSESENDANHKKEKNQQRSEEENDEQNNENNNIVELPSKLEAKLDNDLELEKADMQKGPVPELQLVDENANEKTSDEVEELDDEDSTPRQSPIAPTPVATPRRGKSDVQHEEVKEAEEDSGSDDKDLKQTGKEEKKDHKDKEKDKKKKKESKDNDDKKETKEKEKKKKNKKNYKEEEEEDEEEVDDKKAKNKKDKKKKENDKTKEETEEEDAEEEEKVKKKKKPKKKEKSKEKIDDESNNKKKKTKRDGDEENEADENKKSKNKTQDQSIDKKTEENNKDMNQKEEVKNGEEIPAEKKEPVKANPPKKSRLCTIL